MIWSDAPKYNNYGYHRSPKNFLPDSKFLVKVFTVGYVTKLIVNRREVVFDLMDNLSLNVSCECWNQMCKTRLCLKGFQKLTNTFEDRCIGWNSICR